MGVLWNVLPPAPVPFLPPLAQQKVSKSPCEAMHRVSFMRTGMQADSSPGKPAVNVLAHRDLHTFIGLEAASSGHIHCIAAEGHQGDKLPIVRVTRTQVSTGW